MHVRCKPQIGAQRAKLIDLGVNCSPLAQQALLSRVKSAPKDRLTVARR